METVRQSKVARLVQKELARYFQVESRSLLPGKMITVTVVRVTPDLGLAKVYLSIFPKEQNEDNLEVVSKQTKTIRTALGKNIRYQVRIIPELAFYLDDSMDYVERIDRLLKS
jgi:ribosome-binding factor A